MSNNDAILSHLGNAPQLDATPRFAAIIGERPSQGARSPLLWNAVFEAEDLSIRFHPFDVTAEALEPLVATLRADERFIGGAVTMPHKEAVLPFLDRVEEPARKIGAVNALYRDGTQLVGTNTDGAGALSSLYECCQLRDKLLCEKVVVIGAGGAGQAVAVYLAEAMGDGGQVLVSNRNMKRAQSLARKIGSKASTVFWPPSHEDLVGVSVIVNCSSIGFAPEKEAASLPERYLTPLSSETEPTANIRESLETLISVGHDCVVFDIVYQPSATMLLTIASGLGMKTLGGLPMNLEQAVIAFNKAVPYIAVSRVREIMSHVD